MRVAEGPGGLEEALALWERGEQLAAVCQQRLAGAKAKVDAARSKSAGPEG